jgi:D-psicose/D-tagatose/L-ribulose 3-epimerase
MTNGVETLMRFGISSRVFGDWSIERIFTYAAEVGYDGVEIIPRTFSKGAREISQRERRGIRDLADSSGIDIVGLHSLLVWPDGFHISHVDEAVRKRTQTHLRELIHLCADLGGRLLVHGSGTQRMVEKGWNPAEALENALETFRICARTAEQRDVLYCLEPLRRVETNFVNTVEEAVKVVEKIANPHFKITLDCRHTLSNETEELPHVIKRVFHSGHLGHVHLNDLNGRGPGFGRVLFSPVLKALKEINYPGYASVEVFEYDPDPQTIASRSIGYLKGIWEVITAE